MITITIPLWPTIIAGAFLFGFMWMIFDDAGDLGNFLFTIAATVITFFTVYGITTMLGMY